MEFKELRERSGMNMTQFSAYFGISYRTVQRWEYGERNCPKYLLDLMEYKLRHESKLKTE
jgi:DNA-binding transcriptional regulator YiaG